MQQELEVEVGHGEPGRSLRNQRRCLFSHVGFLHTQAINNLKYTHAPAQYYDGYLHSLPTCTLQVGPMFPMRGPPITSTKYCLTADRYLPISANVMKALFVYHKVQVRHFRSSQ
jgi:hypothetical protein